MALSASAITVSWWLAGYLMTFLTYLQVSRSRWLLLFLAWPFSEIPAAVRVKMEDIPQLEFIFQ